MRVQYSSSFTPPLPTLTTIAALTTVKSAGTKSIWLQCRTIAGVTLFSSRAEITITASLGIAVTIPAGVKRPASAIHEIWVILSNDTNPNNGVVVASVAGNVALPTTINLTRDEHFSTTLLDGELRVSTPAQLPSNPINGMRRYVESVAKILEYKSGVWNACNPQVFNAYITNTLGEMGCDQEASAIEDTSIILVPDYDQSGNLSTPTDFWIVNDTTSTINQGTRISLSAAIDNTVLTPSKQDETDPLMGLLWVTPLGVVNMSTGVLDTSDPQVGGAFLYLGNQLTPLRLAASLPPNHAYAIRVQAKFEVFDLFNQALKGSILSFYPRFSSVVAIPDSSHKEWGDRILAESGRRRIIPSGTGLSLKALPGSGRIGGAAWDDVGESPVFGLLANTPNQKVAVTNNATCLVVSTVPEGTAALRAIVSTSDGVGSATAWAMVTLTAGNTLLKLTLTHPTAIREDYPDGIAGTVAPLNANRVRVYTRVGGVIRYQDVLINGVSGEEILIGNVAGTVIASLPAVASDFGLFSLTSFTASGTTGTSTFSAGNIEVAVAYLYVNTVTSITHSSRKGCVLESSGTIVDLYQTRNSWGGAVVLDDQTLDDAIKNLTQDEIWEFQTRRIEDELRSQIYYDPDSVLAENLNPTDPLDRVWRPVWRSASQPGRWRVSLGARLSVASAYKGTWSSATAYIRDNIVYYNGASWVCLQSHTNQVPATNSTYWGIFGGTPQDQVLGLILALGD